MSDKYFEERKKAFWEEVEQKERAGVVSLLLGLNPRPTVAPGTLGALALHVHLEERELAIAQKILDGADEGEPNHWHAVVNVRDREQRLHAAQTELASAEVKEKMFSTLTKWDEHKLDARLGEDRPFKTEFGLVHTDESFARSTALSVLKEKRSDKAIAIAEAANKLSQKANTLAETANENADMANTHMITAEETAKEANRRSARSNWISVVSAVAAVAAAIAAFSR